MRPTKQQVPHIRYFLLCEEATITEDDRFDCIKVFDDISIPILPAQVKMDIVVGLDRIPPDREYKLSFVLEDPDGQRRPSPDIAIPRNLADPTPTYIMSADLPFAHEGRYTIHVMFDTVEAEFYDFTIHLVPEKDALPVLAGALKE